jgi:hypothetical protein
MGECGGVFGNVGVAALKVVVEEKDEAVESMEEVSLLS